MTDEADRTTLKDKKGGEDAHIKTQADRLHQQTEVTHVRMRTHTRTHTVAQASDYQFFFFSGCSLNLL